jgi:hypothetical protein
MTTKHFKMINVFEDRSRLLRLQKFRARKIFNTSSSLSVLKDSSYLSELRMKKRLLVSKRSKSQERLALLVRGNLSSLSIRKFMMLKTSYGRKKVRKGSNCSICKPSTVFIHMIM